MKRLTIFLLLIFAGISVAQNDQQGIELPDFVITGRQSVNVPIAHKGKPELIPTLSKDFFTPQFTPDELPLMISSQTVSFKPDIKTFDDYYNGSLKIQLGRYTFPTGELSMTKSLNNYLFNTRVWGSNIKDFLSNSGFNTSGLSMTHNFFISTKSEFLPGTAIKIFAQYSRDSYKFFASPTPDLLRESNKGIGQFSISSSLNRWVNYGAGVNINVLSLNENGFRESVINPYALFDIKMNGFKLGFNGTYKRQTLQGNLSSTSNYNYYSVEGSIKFVPMNSLLFSAGVNYSAVGSNNFFATFAAVQYQIDKNFSFDAEYKPHTNFYSVRDLIGRNLYYNLGANDNAFEKVKHNFVGMLKYENDKYMTITLSGGYSQTENFSYFSDVVNPGKFDLRFLPEAKIFFGKLNMYYYTGIYGYFMGDLTIQDAKDQSGNKIPYQPEAISTLEYGYDFDFGLGIKAKYKLALNAYTDLANTDKLQDYNDLSLSFSYELLKGFKITADFQNILNRSNFAWRQYQEKPFDILAGIEYRW